MDTILLTGALLDQGLSYNDLARLSRRGELERIRRGAYATSQRTGLVREEAHRRLIQATVPQLIDGSVVSHGSAATLHRLPVWSSAITRVHVTRPGEGQRRPLLHLHCAALTSDDIVLVEGIPATSVARTVLDLARTLRMEYAVAAADRALCDGLDPQRLTEGLYRMRRWPGVRAARRAVAFADSRSGSVGESVSRVRIHLDGLPRPELQYEIRGPGGLLIATTDFAGRSGELSGSSTARSSTAGCSGRVSGLKTWSSTRSCGRTQSAVRARRLPGGSGTTAGSPASSVIGCFAPLTATGRSDATYRELLLLPATCSSRQEGVSSGRWAGDRPERRGGSQGVRG